jgi:hypothetical protein
VASPTPRPLYPREKDPIPIVQEAGWAPGPVWTAAENLAPTGIRSPDRPARSESLYRLSYRGLCEEVAYQIQNLYQYIVVDLSTPAVFPVSLLVRSSDMGYLQG